MVHVFAAAFGVSAIVAQSAVAMQYLRWIGAAYLIYLGIQKLREIPRQAAPEPQVRETRSLWRIYTDGVVVNTFNPKTALFFFAFLPQFVDATHGSAMAQLFFLGGCFIVLAVLSDSAYALAAASIARAAKRAPRMAAVGAYGSAAVYIGLGIATAANARSK